MRNNCVCSANRAALLGFGTKTAWWRFGNANTNSKITFFLMLNRCYCAASGRKLTRIVFLTGWILMQNLAVYNKRKTRKMWRGWHKVIISENANSRVTVGMLLCSCRRGWREDPADSEGREAERSGGFQHQDAAPHPDPAAQRQSGQPDHKEPQEEGRRHGLFNLLPVGWPWVCVCVWRLSRICIFKIIKFRCGDFGFFFFPFIFSSFLSSPAPNFTF